MRRRFDDFTVSTTDFIDGLKNDSRFESDVKFRVVAKLLSSLSELYGECAVDECVLRDASNDVITRAIKDFESSGCPSEWANGAMAYDGLDNFWEFMTKFCETKLDTNKNIEPWLIDCHMHRELCIDREKPREAWRYRFTVIGIELTEEINQVDVLDLHYFTVELLTFMFYAFINASIRSNPPSGDEYFKL